MSNLSVLQAPGPAETAYVPAPRTLKALLAKCRKSDSNFLWALLHHLLCKLSGQNILANHRTAIRGRHNIRTGGLLQIGLSQVGFMHRADVTYLNIRGALAFTGDYAIGKGCRFDVGPGALATFGSGYVNAKSTFIIMHGITVGDGCAISWGCEFLDEDFHHIAYADKKPRAPEIVIGDHVWIGSNVSVLKGSRIPDGCVVASGSVVTSVFATPGCLIGGNPARVVKENVTWE